MLSRASTMVNANKPSHKCLKSRNYTFKINFLLSYVDFFENVALYDMFLKQW